jgi:hypothetical protein
MATPFLQYLIAALRLLLIASVFNAAYQTNSTSDPLVTALLVAIWGTEAASVLDSDSDQNRNADHSMCVVLMAVVQTGFVLVLSKSVDLAYVWVAPAFCVFLLAFFMEDAPSEPINPKMKKTHQIRRYTRPKIILLALFVLGFGIAELFLLGSGDGTFVSLCVAQLTSSLLLLVLLNQYTITVTEEENEPDIIDYWSEDWYGGPILLLAWAWLQLCVTPLLDSTHATFRIVLVFAVLFNASIVRTGRNRAQAFGLALEDIARSISSLVSLVSSSTSILEWVVLASVAVITVSLNDPWWTSKVTFPSEIQSLCNDALSVVETVVQPIYQFTSDKDVQRVMAVAIPELAGLRSTIYRLLIPIWGSLLDGSQGRTFTHFPVGNFFAMFMFAVGPLLTFMGVLAKLFPEGRFFSKSMWFWAAAVLGNIAFVAFTQITPDTSVFFVYTVLEDTQYTRTYTRSGTQAVVAQAVLVGACLVLFVQTSIEESGEEITERGPAGIGSALEVPGNYLRRVCRGFGRGILSWINWLSSASFVLFVIGVFFLAVTITSTGSPISSIQFEKRPLRAPEWLVSTTLDKVSALSISVFRMLSPQERLVVLTAAIVQYGVDQINCWGCLCVPDFKGGVEGAISGFSSIGSAFGFRRRLLAFSPADPVTFGPRRRLLASGRAVCNPVSCNSGLVRLCILDVVADGVEKLTDLTIGAADFVFDFIFNDILSRIPIIKIAADLLQRLPGISIYRDLDIFQKIRFSFNLKLFGFDLGLVPTLGINLPSTSGASFWSVFLVIAVVLLGFFVARKLGIQQRLWIAFSSTLQILFVSTLLTSLVTVAALYYFLLNEAKIQGYDVYLKPASNLWMYATGLGMLVLSLFLRIGEELGRGREKGGTKGRFRKLNQAIQ